MGQKVKVGLLCVSLLSIGVLCGWFIANFANINTARLQSKYDLLSKRIFINSPNDILLDFSGLKREVGNYLGNNSSGKTSFYFEYLPTGSSVSFNEDEEVVGASLLKLPVVIKIYKLAGQGKIDLDEMVALKKEWLNNSYGDLYKKGEGYRLTVRDAVNYALEKSDNTAVLLLFSKLEQAEGVGNIKLLDFVDARFEVGLNQEILIGSESYSSVLKCLYFSCYLNIDNSQDILNKLAIAEDKSRLLRRIPEGVRVAHKIGVYGNEAQSDCGIFYIDEGERNYLLCVMIKGKDPQASDDIADLSKIVYDYVTSQNK